MNIFEGKVFIDGNWQDPESGETLPVMDPSDGSEFGRIACGSAVDIDCAVQAAQNAMDGEWGKSIPVERGRLLQKLSALILKHEDELTEMEARDVGKPLTQARVDVKACARYFEFYGGAADKVHGETIPYLEGYTVLTLREPHGVTGHIIPWNYPLQIIGRTIGGALTMGNACVLKPGEEASQTALMVGELARQAGFPPGVFNIVPGLGEEAGNALIHHSGVNHLSFTGSTEVGALVQQAAAKNAVPVTLELGGKSPQVVFADADLEKALPFLVNASIQNCGQTCSAASRVIAESSIYEKLLKRLAERFKELRVGPAFRDLNCGPLISPEQKKRVEKYLNQAKADGLNISAEGKIMEDTPAEGNYVKPMLIRDVPPEHEVAQEELFGPILVAMPFYSEEEAVKLANGTPFGLVSGIWTNDGARQFRVAKRLKSGQVFINNYGAGGGVELPFGGVKLSGHGREKGFEALYGFSVTKTIAIQHGI
ncbi:MAG: aldehyde dehydrogenase family protein [SAR324 cluster bacterium]|nr:aldehyde dehydrogenase family protein [SAR324 cluster bacterium]MDP6294617.1 aldehyde dehydrogenase family protein [SAR324 cluster bacterium]MDP7047599.1 aldehyde dehydrogenase family protein [SAR324 cluster bacterium]RZO41904.1 MAG: aldehyde dehydrogenase family protein [Pseudomonadota bacterium]